MELARLARPPVSYATVAAVPKKRRPPLDRDKCKNCRQDKQKCAPQPRTWPKKCDRCLAKGFACSDGSKAQRKRRNFGQASEAPTYALSDTPKIVRDWIFFMGFREMMSMARVALVSMDHEYKDRFGNKFLPIFSGTIDEHNLLLEALDNRLTSMTMEMIETNIQTHAVTRDATIAKLLADKYRTKRALPYRAMATKCAICDDNSMDSTILDTFNSHCIIQRLLVSSEQWSYHCLHTRIGPTSIVSDEICSKWQLFVQLCDRAELQALTLLKEYDISIPPNMEECPIFLPTSISAFPRCRKKEGPVDCLGRTRLHQYLEYQNSVSQYELDIKPQFQLDVNAVDIFGRTPLHISCGKGRNMDWVPWLLNNGANVNVSDYCGATPLHYAAASGLKIVCTVLLESPDININATTGEGGTALSLAVDKRYHQIIRLLANHPEIDLTKGRDVFVHAILNLDDISMDILLDSRKAVDYFQAHSKDYMFNIIDDVLDELSVGHEKIFIRYLERIPVTYINECSIVWWAAFGGYLELVKGLASIPGVDINSRDEFGRTALNSAVSMEETEIVKFLLTLPTLDLELRNDDGETACEIACRKGYTEIADLIQAEDQRRTNLYLRVEEESE